MRNLKKVLAAIIVVTMIMSTMMISVFAEDTPASDDQTAVDKTPAQVCEALGVLKGGDKGVDALYLATPTERIQAAIIYLRLLGLEDEARAYDGTDNFADANKVSDPSAVKLMAYLKANPELGWVGDGKNFNPDDEVSAQQLYKVFLSILGYEQGTDFDYAETLYFAKFVGMSQIADKIQITNADLATGLVEVLKCQLKGGGPEDTLIAQLVNSGKISEDVAVANGFEVSVLKIASIVAPAAKDVAWGTADPGLPASVTANLTNGTQTSVDVTWDLSNYDSKKIGKVTIKGTIEGFADGVSVDVNVKELVLDIASVEIVNSRQMVVTYNGPVKGDAVKDKTKYTVTNGNATAGVNPIDVALSDDATTATLTVAYADRFPNYSTDNKVKVLKDVGLSADKTVENVVCRDTVVPTLVSAVPTAPNKLKVTFSEPVYAVNTASYVAAFSVDEGKIGLDYSVASTNGNMTEVTLKTLADFTEGTHTIKVSGNYIVDGSIYPVAGNTVSFDYAKDTSPVTVSVKSSSENKVTLKFNKDVINVKDANVRFSHTYKGFSPIQGNDARVNADSDSEYTIDFSSHPFPPGATTLYIAYDNGSGTKIKDGWGNEFAEASIAINTSADSTAPTVAAEFEDYNKVKVTFSEDVINTTNTADTNNWNASAANPANYTLKLGSDTITVNSVTVDDHKVFHLNTNEINGGTLTLVIKNVKDTSIAANKIADTTLTFNASDKVKPRLDATTPFVEISDTKFRVNFSEALDVASLTDSGNYRSGDAKEIDKVEAVNGNKSAVITFKTAPAINQHIFVGRVKDVAGNYAAWLEQDCGTISGVVTHMGVDTADMVATNRIKLTIKDQITNFGTVADYCYSLDGHTFYNVTGIASATVDSADNKSYIELTIGADIPDDNTDLSNPVYIATTDGTTVGVPSANVKNALGQTLQIAGTQTVSDKVGPKYLAVSSKVINGTKLKQVVAQFSEDLYLASVQDSDFTVEGFEIESVVVDNSNVDGYCYVTITLKDKDNSSAEKPKVTLVGTVEDVNRNALTGPKDNTCP